MRTKSIATFALAAAFAAAPASAAKKSRPEAADQTFGTAIMTATVGITGEFLAGSGALSSEWLQDTGIGSYEVAFSRNVTGCVPSVTPIALNSSVVSAQAAADADWVGLAGNRVFVRIDKPSGGEIARAFYLMVFCPQ